MSDDNVSEFKPRRKAKQADAKAKLADAIKTAAGTGGQTGTGLGDFDRNPCGECFHFKREPRAGLGVGKCMLFPPAAFPVQNAQGQPGQILIRPILTADTEGCDQFDDEEIDEEDDDGEPATPTSPIVAAG